MSRPDKVRFCLPARDDPEFCVVHPDGMFESVENRECDMADTPRATVILFKPSGKYYTEEDWIIPEGATGPYDMKRSPDFRRIGDGAVLVDTQEPWGYPHLFPGV